jgi:hypothetical protein
MNKWQSILKQKSKKALSWLRELTENLNFSIYECSVVQLHCETCGAYSLPHVVEAILKDKILLIIPDKIEYCKCQLSKDDHPFDLKLLEFPVMLLKQKEVVYNTNICIHPVFP